MNHGKEIFGRFMAGLIVLFLFIGGCAVGPDYIKPTVTEPKQWIEEDPKIKKELVDISQWWKVLNDPVLDELIDMAYKQNLPLRITGIRVLEARAQLGIAVGDLYPQQQLGRGGLTYSSLSENSPNTTATADFGYSQLDLGFDAAWELDFWGKFRRAVQSGLAGVDVSIANYDGVLVTLTAEVARVYVLIRTIEERLVIARNNVKIQERSLSIARARFKGGDVTELDVAQARSLLADTKATIPALEAELRQAKNGLAILLGTLPGQLAHLLREPKPIPRMPPEVTVGIPAELLRRRPDIRLAERQMAAQSALIGVAKADLYPHFTLFGSIGLRSSDASLTAVGFTGGSSLGDLWDSDSIEFFGGAGFSWDIFNYGRIRNRIRVQDARFQQLAVNYQDAVLRAAQEVEDAMAAFLRSQEQVGFLSESVDAATRSVKLSTIQYREGMVDFQRVLDTQRFQTQEQDLYTATRGSVAFNLIAIYKALGGGWQIREGKDFVPEETKEEMRQRTNWGDLLSPEELKTGPAEKTGGSWKAPDW